MMLSFIRRVMRVGGFRPLTSIACFLEAGQTKSKVSNATIQSTRDETMACLKECSGNSIVEFALTLPFLAWMLLGVFKTGMAFNSYLTLQSAVNQGAYSVANNATAPTTTDPCNLAYTAVSSVTPQFNSSNLNFTMKLNGSATLLTGTGSSFSCVIGAKNGLQGVTPDDPVVLTVSYPIDMNIMGVNIVPNGFMSATSEQNVQVLIQ